jgi:hypothetical protein
MENSVRINCSVTGEAAEALRDLKRRGICKSNREAIVQALLALHERILERDLRYAQLRTLREAEE